ncbi:MAG TPA: hypothetical protein VLB27_08965, partial [candidate division Zixibacteria bacterium]|nr:hypothetical protein [candidate division Zixibacteria bacterium]
MNNKGTARATGLSDATVLLRRRLAAALALSCALAVAGSTAICAKPLWLLEYPDSVAQAPGPAATPLRVETDVSQPIFGDTAYALCHVATVQVGSGGGSDCWGWVDGSGNQYAIMGIN